MATNTTNYNLKKPAATDNYNVADQNSNMDIIDAALTPTADPAQVPTGSTGKLSQWVSWIANRIKAITGGSNWYDAPATTLQAANTHANSTTAHSATSAATANRIMMRDAIGRVKVAAPTAADDVARKDTVDALAGVGNTKTVKQVDDAVGQLAANMENIGDSVIVKSPIPPEGIVEGRLWLDESDNTYQGTIMEDYLAHKADYAKFVIDYEYQNATVVGSQLRLTRNGSSKRIYFKLNADVSGAITVSLDGGSTSKPLKDLDGNPITTISKGFAEVVDNITFFTYASKGGIKFPQNWSNEKVATALEAISKYDAINIDTMMVADNGIVDVGPDVVISKIEINSAGTLMAVALSVSPYFALYRINGRNFTKLPNPITQPSWNPLCMAFNQAGTLLVLASNNSSTTERIIYSISGEMLTSVSAAALTHIPSPTRVFFSPDGSKFFISGIYNSSTAMYTVNGTTFTYATSASGGYASVSPTGSFIITVGSTYLNLYTIGSSTLTSRWGSGYSPDSDYSPNYSPPLFYGDGYRIVIGHRSSYYTVIINPSTYSVSTMLLFSNSGYAVGSKYITADGKYLLIEAILNVTGKYKVYSVNQSTFDLTFVRYLKSIGILGFYPSVGRFILSDLKSYEFAYDGVYCKKFVDSYSDIGLSLGDMSYKENKKVNILPPLSNLIDKN